MAHFVTVWFMRATTRYDFFGWIILRFNNKKKSWKKSERVAYHVNKTVLFKNLPYQQPYYFQIIANGINYLYHLANIYKLRNPVFYLWFLFFVYWDIGTYTVLNPILKFYIFSSYPRVCLIKVQNHHSYKNWWFFKIRPKNCQFFFSNEQFL